MRLVRLSEWQLGQRANSFPPVLAVPRCLCCETAYGSIEVGRRVWGFFACLFCKILENSLHNTICLILHHILMKKLSYPPVLLRYCTKTRNPLILQVSQGSACLARQALLKQTLFFTTMTATRVGIKQILTKQINMKSSVLKTPWSISSSSSLVGKVWNKQHIHT